MSVLIDLNLALHVLALQSLSVLINRQIPRRTARPVGSPQSFCSSLQTSSTCLGSEDRSGSTVPNARFPSPTRSFRSRVQIYNCAIASCWVPGKRPVRRNELRSSNCPINRRCSPNCRLRLRVCHQFAACSKSILELVSSLQLNNRRSPNYSGPPFCLGSF